MVKLFGSLERLTQTAVFKLRNISRVPLRPKTAIINDFFRLGIKIKSPSPLYLSYYPRDMYESLTARLNAFLEIRKFDRFIAPAPDEIMGVDFRDLPDEFLLLNTMLFALDLSDLGRKYAIYNKRRLLSESVSSSKGHSPTLRPFQIAKPDSRVISLLDVVAAESSNFQRLAERGEATVDKIFELLDKSKRHLGFNNVVVFRPLQDGKWHKTYGTDFPVVISDAAFQSILDSDEKFFDLDINGSGRILIFKLVSAYGTEAIVQIHNRVQSAARRRIPQVLPTKPENARRVVDQLHLYFDAVVRAIEHVRTKRQSSADASRRIANETIEGMEEPFSLIQYHGGSALYASGEFTTEYNGNPSKNYVHIWSHVFRDYNSVVKDVTGSEMSDKELREHALYVEHSLTDRKVDEITGFALADEHSDYRNFQKKPGRLIYFAGIMVKKAYRGGRTAALNFIMMRNVFRNLGWFKLFFYKTPLVFRTQDDRILKMGIRYYSAKNDPQTFNNEDWNAVRFAAKRYKWALEGDTNIVRNVYSRRMADDISFVFSDLNEFDAKVCIGYVTIASLFKIFLDDFLFRIKRKKKKAKA